MITELQLKNIKLVVLDLDGTLLKSDGSIGEETKKIIKTLRGKGVRFSFATGRLHNAVVEYAAELDIHTPIISLDGSLIKTFPENNILFESYVPVKYVTKALKIADKLLLNIALCHADAIYYTDHNQLVPRLMEKFGAKYELVDSYNNYLDATLEIAVSADSRENIRFLENKMTFPSSFGLSTIFYKSHNKSGIYFLEIKKHGSTKGTGLKRLAKKLKINIKETAVVGDWYNDRDLFKTDAVKIAVQNAVPEIINMADHVTKRTNDEEGVAEFLEMVLKAKSDG